MAAAPRPLFAVLKLVTEAVYSEKKVAPSNMVSDIV